ALEGEARDRRRGGRHSPADHAQVLGGADPHDRGHGVLDQAAPERPRLRPPPGRERARARAAQLPADAASAGLPAALPLPRPPTRERHHARRPVATDVRAGAGGRRLLGGSLSPAPPPPGPPSRAFPGLPPRRRHPPARDDRLSPAAPFAAAVPADV